MLVYMYCIVTEQVVNAPALLTELLNLPTLQYQLRSKVLSAYVNYGSEHEWHSHMC